MTSPLERLAGPDKALAAEPPDATEFAGLKRSGLTRLNDRPLEIDLQVAYSDFAM